MEREDLGALFGRITRRLTTAEQPILAEHGFSMWAYIALSRLALTSAGSQLELARTMGYDKTRLIAILDELERRGLVAREPDPLDRRARIVRLTKKGRVRHAAVRTDIRAMERRLLRGLSAAERQVLLEVLPRLARATPGET